MRPLLRLNGQKISKKPSAYPLLAFHSIRLGQLLSSLIVAIILIFFVHQLKLEHYSIPWTFLLLLTVSLLTLVSLTITTILHTSGMLSARQNFFANTGLLVLWILGLAFLTWNLGWTLGHRCIIRTWHNSDGIMVCRLYKACTSFTVTGTFTTALALFLDFRVQRKSKERGVYNQMLDIKAPMDVRGTSPLGGKYHGETRGDAKDGSVPDLVVREPSTDLQRPYKVRKAFEAQQFGYERPEEQTSYGGSGHEWDERM